MSASEHDLFNRLEQEIFGDCSLELPPDPLEGIVSASTDPLDGAVKLHEYANTLSDEATERIVRLGTNALRTKHYARFSHSDLLLEAVISSGEAFPEADPKLRKRDNTSYLRIKLATFVRGSFNNIVSSEFNDVSNRRLRYMPAIVMQCPVILNEFSGPVNNIELPDYLIFPIASLYKNKYKFIPSDSVEPLS